ncbi:hypothetical protein KBY75_04800 [Cyanobium sp. T1G-Tous]|uniref:hypothetical protein n=1 Tax=Cyanobium sp. T1G-Tous TaxID=2823722 RepID=UPI0020CD7534|nr:hypothetical protein [Cyanobium sp. T1G-Tous]MCP9802881.1 hypothetical protein [Cyanobium sp. T1G-Tous]
MNEATNETTKLFSAIAAAYARHRITYPAAFLDAFLGHLISNPLVWECGCGCGCGLDNASVDGVLVAAAVHWFAGDAFNTEVRRVCKSGAVVAWIGYLPLRLADQRLQSSLDAFHSVTLAPWWPAERRWVEQSYAGLAFPAEE